MLFSNFSLAFKLWKLLKKQVESQIIFFIKIHVLLGNVMHDTVHVGMHKF